MGRHEGELDPHASPLEAFAHGLRELRQQAGGPSYRELARRTHYSPSALSTAANGRSTPSLAVVEAYVKGCGGDIGEWQQRWYNLTAGAPPTPAEEPEPTEVLETSEQPPRRRPLRRAALIAAAAVVAVGGAATAVVAIRPGTATSTSTSTSTSSATESVVPGTGCDSVGHNPLAPPFTGTASPQAHGQVTFQGPDDVHKWGNWWNKDKLIETVTALDQSTDPVLRVEVTSGFTAVGTTRLTGLKAGDRVTVRIGYYGQGEATLCPFVQTPDDSESWVRVPALDLDTKSTQGWRTYQWTIPPLTVKGTGFQINNNGHGSVVIYIDKITW